MADQDVLNHLSHVLANLLLENSLKQSLTSLLFNCCWNCSFLTLVKHLLFRRAVSKDVKSNDFGRWLTDLISNDNEHWSITQKVREGLILIKRSWGQQFTTLLTKIILSFEDQILQGWVCCLPLIDIQGNLVTNMTLSWISWYNTAKGRLLLWFDRQIT